MVLRAVPLQTHPRWATAPSTGTAGFLTKSCPQLSQLPAVRKRTRLSRRNLAEETQWGEYNLESIMSGFKSWLFSSSAV
jgi:hypothetical protein